MNPPSQDRPRGLGRGLSALIGDEVAAMKGEPIAKKDTRTLPVAFLQPGKYQPRKTFDDQPMNDLAASIKEKGVLSPILVRPIGPDRYEIVAGERRWRASQIAKLHDVPVVIREMADSEALELAIIENVQRADLNALEEAAAYRQLMDEPFKRTQEEVAQHVGKSRSHIANTIRLMNLPPQVQVWLREGKLTAGHARTLLGAADPEAAAHALIEGGMSVREAEARAPAKKKAGGKPAKDPNIADLETTVSNVLGLKTQITHKGDKSGDKGEVRIAYTSLEQLDEVVRRLSRN
ncbi:MAG TPA: ParB/RepB/Spo0J family partition protein [Rhizomicrobium sp.]|jgi:ParB family chromosome partitioning protein